jgi:hypothetical protein
MLCTSWSNRKAERRLRMTCWPCLERLDNRIKPETFTWTGYAFSLQL